MITHIWPVFYSDGLICIYDYSLRYYYRVVGHYYAVLSLSAGLTCLDVPKCATKTHQTLLNVYVCAYYANITSNMLCINFKLIIKYNLFNSWKFQNALNSHKHTQTCTHTHANTQLNVYLLPHFSFTSRSEKGGWHLYNSPQMAMHCSDLKPITLDVRC